MTREVKRKWAMLLLSDKIDFKGFTRIKEHYTMIQGSIQEDREITAIYVPSIVLFSCSVVYYSLRPHDLQGYLTFTISWNLFKVMSIESIMPSNRFILCRPLLLLPSIFPSIRVFSNNSALTYAIVWSQVKQ